MYGILLGLTLLKPFRPYFRKHISDILDHHEYFLLSTLMILFIIFMYTVYLVCISKTTTVGKMLENVSCLSCTEVSAIFVLSCLTVISGLLIFELDKNHNTPLMNDVLLKSMSTIAVICVGVFIFKEKYKIHQVGGIGLVIAGLYLASRKNI
jgi:drug/metabolite transporter (DMT)-like permease